ncbi:MAG: AraC family transcriptional regulator [Bacteroidota bacterium]|nr:AraC family transcriptional regulator [Bacteroidota bacterium]
MTIEPYSKVYLYKRIVQAKLFIDTHYADKIDINQISDEAYFSKFHFIRLFKQIYGYTPHQYLTAVRIDNAILLFQKGKPVSDVCFCVGFDSLSSFSGLFKKRTGCLPSHFLKKEQNKKQQLLENPFQYISACFAHQLGWAKHSNFEEAES